MTGKKSLSWWYGVAVYVCVDVKSVKVWCDGTDGMGMGVSVGGVS